MRWIWNDLRPRSRTHSRPRVSRAAEAARMAQMAPVAALSEMSRPAGLAALVAPPPPPARSTVRDIREGHAGRDGRDGAMGSAFALKLPPMLLRETVRAARGAGRSLEDVWAEALGDWLNQHQTMEAASPYRLNRDMRRQRSWGEIEETLRALRAS